MKTSNFFKNIVSISVRGVGGIYLKIEFLLILNFKEESLVLIQLNYKYYNNLRRGGAYCTWGGASISFFNGNELGWYTISLIEA